MIAVLIGGFSLLALVLGMCSWALCGIGKEIESINTLLAVCAEYAVSQHAQHAKLEHFGERVEIENDF